MKKRYELDTRLDADNAIIPYDGTPTDRSIRPDNLLRNEAPQ
jgi:hypothetical protein